MLVQGDKLATLSVALEPHADGRELVSYRLKQ